MSYWLNKRRVILFIMSTPWHFMHKRNLAMLLAKVKHPALCEGVAHTIGTMLVDQHITKGLLELCDCSEYSHHSHHLKDFVRQGIDSSTIFHRVESEVHVISEIDKESGKIVRVCAPTLVDAKVHHMKHSLVHLTTMCATSHIAGRNPFPVHFSWMHHIVELNIAFRGDRHPTFELPDMAMLSTLKEFILHGSNVVGDFPQWIHHWKCLETFDIQGTCIQGTVPPNIGACLQMEFFNIQDTLVSDKMPKELGQCSSLTCLRIATKNKQANLRSIYQLWDACPALTCVHVNISPIIESLNCSFLDMVELSCQVYLHGLPNPEVVHLSQHSRYFKQVRNGVVKICQSRIFVMVYDLDLRIGNEF